MDEMSCIWNHNDLNARMHKYLIESSACDLLAAVGSMFLLNLTRCATAGRHTSEPMLLWNAD